MRLNVGCGPHLAPKPWVNLDCHDGDGVHPDRIVDADAPLAGYETGSVEAVYLGHVLEHTPWPEVPRFLRDIARALVPGGQVMVVGPDVYRTIKGWRDGVESWELVESVLEMDSKNPEGARVWPNARHWWNCTEARVERALILAGFQEVTALPVTEDALAGWPVVAFAPWQMAVRACSNT